MLLTRGVRRGLSCAARTRAYVARTGENFRGDRIWTQEERETIRAHHPDYDLLAKKLRHRSRQAIKAQACGMGITARQHIWTNPEATKLRRLWASKATDAELQAAFPEMRMTQIRSKAKHLRLPRRFARLKVLGVPALDAVRAKASEHGMTLGDLDALAHTRCYFQRAFRTPVWKHIGRAVQLFEGTLVVDWAEADR